LTGSERGERDVFRVCFTQNQLMLKGFPATAPARADAGTARAKDEAWPPKPAAPNQRRDAMERTNEMLETTIPQGRTVHI